MIQIAGLFDSEIATEVANKAVIDTYARRQESGAALRAKLDEYPDVADDLQRIKDTFGPEHVRLTWIRFTDGTEIGRRETGY